MYITISGSSHKKKYTTTSIHPPPHPSILMLNIAVRPHIMHPHTAYQPLEGPHSFHPAGIFNNFDSPRSPISLGSNVRRYSISSGAPSRYQPTQSVSRGLQTPPPDMASGYKGTIPSYNHGQQLRQFEPPIAGNGVPKSLDSFRMSNTQSSSSNQNYIARRRESPPISRRNSIAHPEQHSSSSSSKRRSSTSNAAASMTVPASINNTKANLAEFAAQVCHHWSSQVLCVIA